jgi:hypothetical protein
MKKQTVLLNRASFTNPRVTFAENAVNRRVVFNLETPSDSMSYEVSLTPFQIRILVEKLEERGIPWR